MLGRRKFAGAIHELPLRLGVFVSTSGMKGQQFCKKEGISWDFGELTLRYLLRVNLKIYKN